MRKESHNKAVIKAERASMVDPLLITAFPFVSTAIIERVMTIIFDTSFFNFERDILGYGIIWVSSGYHPYIEAMPMKNGYSLLERETLVNLKDQSDLHCICHNVAALTIASLEGCRENCIENVIP
jgi:hypothetical protein